MYKLRELKREDIKKINEWRNAPELIELLGAPYRFINEEVDNEWFNAYMRSRNTAVRCAIVSEENDEILGLASIVDINYVNRSAVFHIMIGDKSNRGKGIGTFATKSLIEHAFYNLNIRRIELSVLSTNVPAIKTYEKIGFVKEGIKRQAVYKKGTYVDMIIMSLIQDEYKFGE